MVALDERTKKILLAIIHSYIDLNEPVGSSMVSRRFSFGLSPATIRNTMAELKDLGYLTQPHTSAGRVPTEKGYRLYVNTLLKQKSLSINEDFLKHLSNRLSIIEKGINRLVEETSKTLSEFSRYLALAVPPRAEGMRLKHIEFIRHSSNKVLCILIAQDGTVKNNIITMEEALTRRDLERITNYLNDKLTGLTIKEIKSQIISQMSLEKSMCDRLISRALKMCREAVFWAAENTANGEISGTSNLPEFATMSQIREIFHAIEDKHLIIRMLDKVSDSEGVQVFIGSENIVPEMKGFSMVLSTYNDLGARGTIGVIGPTRMNYEQVIPLVEFTARTLTQILSEGQ